MYAPVVDVATVLVCEPQYAAQQAALSQSASSSREAAAAGSSGGRCWLLAGCAASQPASVASSSSSSRRPASGSIAAAAAGRHEPASLLPPDSASDAQGRTDTLEAHQLTGRPPLSSNSVARVVSRENARSCRSSSCSVLSVHAPGHNPI